MGANLGTNSNYSLNSCRVESFETVSTLEKRSNFSYYEKVIEKESD